jgi:hypothetical protein
MKTFTCSYRTRFGRKSTAQPKEKIEAVSAEEAARVYAERFPSSDPTIDVVNFLSGRTELDNPGAGVTPEMAAAARVEREEAAAAATAARVESLQELLSTVENAGGNLGELSYADLSALIENMRGFRDIRDELSPEECALREKLYMAASFDKSLQALLQTDLLSDLQSTCGDLLAVLDAHTKSSKGSSKRSLLGTAAGLAALNDIRENTD